MPHSDEVLSVTTETAPQAAVAVGASPFTYVAPDTGTVIVQGGTVSIVEIGRKGVFTVTGLIAGPMPVSRGDQVRVTYTVLPTVTYFKR